jgi:hypothetical protein
MPGQPERPLRNVQYSNDAIFLSPVRRFHSFFQAHYSMENSPRPEGTKNRSIESQSGQDSVPQPYTFANASQSSFYNGSIASSYFSHSDKLFVEPVARSRRPSKLMASTPGRKWKRKTLLLVLICVFLTASTLIPIYFLIIKPKANSERSGNVSAANSNENKDNTGNTTTNATSGPTVSDRPSESPNRNDPSSLGIPRSAVGTVLDSTKWLDWTDFNLTYTNATVGGLSIMVILKATCSLTTPRV